VLRGLPGQVEEKKAFGKISFINHLHTDQLNKLVQQAEFVFCRSGYSSIMDIISLQKKSILVPTPGQTEQEYLASYLMKNKLCLAIDQRSFSLQKALITARNFEYVQMKVANQNELVPVAEDLLHRIAGKKAST
jgi:UDP-N-acetylglucosamine:LPS N-acetylglucosamine transferase